MKNNSLLRPRPRRAVLNAATAALLVIVAWLAWSTFQYYTAAALASGELAALHASHKPAVSARPKPADIAIRRQWGVMETEMSFSWYPVFRALEEANNSEIELLEFVPDKAGGRVLLRGEARDQAALTNYVAGLAAQPVFAELYLAHQKIVRKPGMEVLAFEIRSVMAR